MPESGFLMPEVASPKSRTMPPRHEMEQAMLAGDSSYDGVFVVAVRTTGIFCLPSCRPPRRPWPENVEFFGTIREALSQVIEPASSAGRSNWKVDNRRGSSNC